MENSNWLSFIRGSNIFIGLAICLAFLILPGGCMGVFSSPGYAMETITYTIEQTGEQVGRETARMVEKPSENKLSCTVDLTLLQQQVTLESKFEATLQLDSRWKPIHYTLKGRLNRQNVHFEVTFRDDYATALGRRIQVHPKNLVVLDNMLASHYAILIRHYKNNGKPDYRFHAFIPQAMLEVQATMTAKGKARIRMGDAITYLNRYNVVIGSTFLELWADDQDRLMRVTVPAQKLVFAHEDATLFEQVAEQRERTGKRSMSTEEVAFKSGDITLSGAIRRPELIEGSIPAVLFLSGSGRQDRDGQSPDKTIDLQSGQIASHLAEVGHMVLSYDDRGVGLSKNCCESFSFKDEIRDAEAALEFLLAHEHVDTDRVFLIGHSAGAITASKLVGSCPNIAGVVFMAAPGRPLREILVAQAENILRLNNASTDQRKAALGEQQALFKFIETYRPGQKEKVPLPLFAQKASLMWLKELLDHDPLEDYAGLTCPVLILQAGKDLQVSREDARRIAEKLKARGNFSVRVQVFPELDHLFMPSADGNIANYYDRDRSLGRQFLEELSKWMIAQPD